jgi:polyisoprenoid-binding protein YceI
MIRILFTLILCSFLLAPNMIAQKYFTKGGHISFYSDTPLEKIEAHSKSAVAVLDTDSGQMEFSVLIKSFHFEKALMEEHFNENYMETPKYPKSTFKGKIQDLIRVNFDKKGTYPVKVVGELTMHGVSNKVTTDGKIIINDKGIECHSEFNVAVADYKISIPAVVKDSIAKTVKITVKADLSPLKK